MAASLVVLGPVVHAEGNVNIARWFKGTIEYRSLATGEVSGSEEWHLTVHPDGSSTMQTRNRLDNLGFQRHVTYRVGKDLRPLELTSVFWVGGQWRGTGLFVIEADKLSAFINTPDGLIRQERSVPRQFSMIPHPTATNGWLAWYYDKRKGGPQPITVYDMDARAQSVGSMLGKMYEQKLTYVGEEEITTPAGTFRVDHFRVDDTADFYLYGPESIVVRFVWRPQDRDYVLTKLETGR
jgi:hypothetical protein